MSIVTRSGDRGRTSLYGGKRVAKDSPRVELAGTLDEAIAFVGLAREVSRKAGFRKKLKIIREDLFTVCGQVSVCFGGGKTLGNKISREQVAFLEQMIASLEETPPGRIRKFSTAAPGLVAGYCDVVRTLVRRAERRFVSLNKHRRGCDRYLLQYLNRLSDLFYLFSRGRGI